jgi:hypothetical protein
MIKAVRMNLTLTPGTEKVTKISTKYDRSSSATPVDPENATVVIASLWSLSCFESDIDASQREFFYRIHEYRTIHAFPSGSYLIQVYSQSPEFE